MSESAGEKTEQATPKRLEEALKKGQFARSPEVQTVFVLGAGLFALRMVGTDAWQRLFTLFSSVLGNLHKVSLGLDSIQGYVITGALLMAACVGPVILCTVISALLAGGIQSRFTTASEALEPDW